MKEYIITSYIVWAFRIAYDYKKTVELMDNFNIQLPERIMLYLLAYVLSPIVLPISIASKIHTYFDKDN